MKFQLRRGHDGPCPLPTAGGSFGAFALGQVDDEFACYCGRVWQIAEYCAYCVDIKIAHNRHTVKKHWVEIADYTYTSRVLLVDLLISIPVVVALVAFWPF